MEISQVLQIIHMFKLATVKTISVHCFQVHKIPCQFEIIFKRILLKVQSPTTKMVIKESPAAKRNKVPIGEALKKFLNENVTKSLSSNPRVLEIASGCGTHAMHFTQMFPHLSWQPSDFQDESLESIRGHMDSNPRSNLSQPLKIDVCEPYDHWGLKHETYHFMYNANMVHISPWKCSESLFANAGVLLEPNGLLFMYGPFAVNGTLEPKSNQEFDAALKLNNPEWGIRDLKDLEAEASRSNIVLEEVIDLPANNKLVVWKLKE